MSTALQLGPILEPFVGGGPHSRWADLQVIAHMGFINKEYITFRTQKKKKSLKDVRPVLVLWVPSRSVAVS